MAETHHKNPPIAFDEKGDLIPPLDSENKLIGADVHVKFNLVHCGIGRQAGTNVHISAELAEVKLLLYPAQDRGPRRRLEKDENDHRLKDWRRMRTGRMGLVFSQMSG